ncbi:MAG TPA: hypothetical protein VG142_18135 [Trebonia sp.]|nr:hypothetical protein [Trebonia sp.]
MGTDGADLNLKNLIEHGAALRARLEEAGGVLAIGRFLAARRDLTKDDRELLEWWRDDAVCGVFEITAAETSAAETSAAETSAAGTSAAGAEGPVTVLNLVDDLEYRVYRSPWQAGPGMFASGTLLPLAEDDTAWLASGAEVVYPAADGRRVARMAIEMATREPELVFRNPDKARQGWEHMRKDRDEFLAFFGCDEIAFPTVEAEDRLNAYYKMRRDALLAARGRHRQVSESGETTFVMPPGFFEFATVGIIYDQTDGFVVVPEYGMLRELFADPALSADRDHANVLRAYLREDTIPPLPLRRIATAFPAENVDLVFQRILGNRSFTWRQHGEGLLRKRKPRAFEEEPVPGVAVLSDRVLALAQGKS